jgi:hypothetical protein
MDSIFAPVAKLISLDDPPDRLTERLAHFAPLIGYRRNAGDDSAIVEVLKAIDCIESELRIYAQVQEKFDFLDLPECIDRASQALFEFRQFLEEQRRPSRKGGPTPDGRRKLCAGVCAAAWRNVHGVAQPYSTKLQEACEAYWQACGHSETSSTGRLKNWEPFLRAVAKPA